MNVYVQYQWLKWSYEYICLMCLCSFLTCLNDFIVTLLSHCDIVSTWLVYVYEYDCIIWQLDALIWLIHLYAFLALATSRIPIIVLNVSSAGIEQAVYISVLYICTLDSISDDNDIKMTYWCCHFSFPHIRQLIHNIDGLRYQCTCIVNTCTLLLWCSFTTGYIDLNGEVDIHFLHSTLSVYPRHHPDYPPCAIHYSSIYKAYPTTINHNSSISMC